jgi:hypothetical protein
MWFCLCLVLAVDGEEAGEPHAGHQGPEARPQHLRRRERRSSHPRLQGNKYAALFLSSLMRSRVWGSD